MPPSVNHLYVRRRGGSLALSNEGERFQEHVKDVVIGSLGTVSALPVDKETVYEFVFTFYFESLENPLWFERYDRDGFYRKNSEKHRKGDIKYRKGERKAKTRYKKIDYDNRVKFLQDCVAKSIGIPDDCQIFRGVQEKREDSDNPRAEVTVTVIDRDRFFPRREHG